MRDDRQLRRYSVISSQQPAGDQNMLCIKGLHFFISQNIDGGGGKGKGLMVARLVHYPTAELRRALVLGGKGALTRAASMQTVKGAISTLETLRAKLLCVCAERKESLLPKARICALLGTGFAFVLQTVSQPRSQGINETNETIRCICKCCPRTNICIQSTLRNILY